MKMFTESVDLSRMRALTQLGKTMHTAHFYLAGGTALALQLRHRKSVDLDWFVKVGLERPLEFAEMLQTQGIPLVVTSFEDGTLHGTVSGVRVSWLRYRYPLIEPPKNWREKGCDIACMKLVAIAQRGAKNFCRSVCAAHDRTFTRTDGCRLSAQVWFE